MPKSVGTLNSELSSAEKERDALQMSVRDGEGSHPVPTSPDFLACTPYRSPGLVICLFVAIDLDTVDKTQYITIALFTFM
jgi:hypothetical protein